MYKSITILLLEYNCFKAKSILLFARKSVNFRVCMAVSEVIILPYHFTGFFQAMFILNLDIIKMIFHSNMYYLINRFFKYIECIHLQHIFLVCEWDDHAIF